MPGGRPSLYDPKYCDMLIDHMASGLSYESFAGAIGVSRQTIYDWEGPYPEFLDAKKIGLERNLMFWEKAGLQGLWGNKENIFNSTVWIFNMKNRHRWRDRQEVEVKDDSEDIRAKLRKLSMKELTSLIKTLEEKHEEESSSEHQTHPEKKDC